MTDKKELRDFMKKKNMEARGEIDIETDEEEEALKDPPRSVKQEAGEGDVRSAKALAMFRMILNFMFIIPLALVIIGLVGYILLKFLPSMLFFIKRFILMLMQAQ